MRRSQNKVEKPQATRFKQAAKEVGADESEAAFEDKLKQLAQAKLKKADKE